MAPRERTGHAPPGETDFLPDALQPFPAAARTPVPAAALESAFEAFASGERGGEVQNSLGRLLKAAELAPSGEAARVILRFLDAHVLEHFLPLWRVAVQAVLAAGYPFALELSEADLAQARSQADAPGGAKRVISLAAGGIGVAALGGQILAGAPALAAHPLPLVALAASVLGLWATFFPKRGLPAWTRYGMETGALVAIVEMPVDPGPVPLAGVLAALALLTAALPLRLPEKDPPPG